MAYFSERLGQNRPRDVEEVTQAAWAGIVAEIRRLIASGYFGLNFPAECDEGRGITGTNEHMLAQAIRGHFPDLEWPLRDDQIPANFASLDLIEFSFNNIGLPHVLEHHPYPGHDHLRFYPEPGRKEFKERINIIFQRNGLVYDLRDDGQVVRLGPQILVEILSARPFRTGDGTLDLMLEEARNKFLKPDPRMRQEALEELWDAWERIKTLEHAGDKKASTATILDKTGNEATFRNVVEEDAKSLTNIGNDFMIRHMEVNKVPVSDPEHVDYLFHRMSALIRMVLRKSGRGG